MAMLKKVSSAPTMGESQKISFSEVLSSISWDQVPSPEHALKCQEIALWVAMILEKELGSEMPGHVMIAGSYGKGTAIANDSDYDIVIFFNDMEPPFTKVLCKIENAIKDNADRFVGFKWKFKSRIHVCFEVDGVQFDIAPATKFDKSTFEFPWKSWCCFAPSLATPYPSSQCQRTLKKISELKNPERFGYLYSASLAIDAVCFVQRQNSFIHSVIRLAKYWAKHVNTKRIPIRGRSILMETIAIYACYMLNPMEMDEETHLDLAFLNFLELVANVMELRLYVFICYFRSNIPDHIFYQTPLILDPTNPFNNLSSPENFPADALKCFQEAAVLTSKKIKNWASGDREDIGKLQKILQLRDDGDTN